MGINYVIVSGYVSILFGRNRTSEDVDVIIEKLDFAGLTALWEGLYNGGFECVNAELPKTAYEHYLLTGLSIRVSRKGRFVPNIEMKFPKEELDFWTLKEKMEVVVNNHRLFISPLELQIPFKLLLGSEKDIEDARYLYGLFKEKIDLQLLREFNQKLKVERLFDKYLK